MDRHLVSVKVGIVCGAYKRMKLDCLAFNQNRFKCLYSKPVQGRGPVEENRVSLYDLFKYVPYFFLASFYHAFGTFYVVDIIFIYQLLHYKRLEKLKCHLFGQAALMEFQFRSNYYYRPARIVHPLAKKILPESSLFSLEHVRKRFEGSVSRTRYWSPSSSIVNQSVNSFLKHPLFISYNYFRRTQFKQTLEPVVPVYHPSVKVIQIRCCKTSAVKLDHWPQIGRYYRKNVQYHPIRAVAGFYECLNNIKTSDYSYPFLSCALVQFCSQLFGQFFQFYFSKKFFYRFSANACFKGIAVFFLVLTVFPFCKQLFGGKRCIPPIKNYIRSKIQYFLQ